MIAENLGGSIDGFSAKMNRTARELGMQESYFVNPHGLPDPQHVTSARDMAILSRALLLEFPEYQGFFDIGAMRFGRNVIYNNNILLGRYPGANGMKTGFVCSSGDNLVAASKRGKRQVIAVVLGAATAKDRNNTAAILLDRGFNSFGMFAGSLDAWPSNAGALPVDMRPEVCNRKHKQPAGEETPFAGVRVSAGTRPLDLGSAFAEPDVHPSIELGMPHFEPVLVWTGLNRPGEKDIARDEEQLQSARNRQKPAKKKKTVSAPASPTVSLSDTGSDTPAPPARSKKKTKRAGTIDRPEKPAVERTGSTTNPVILELR
ncbi:MAG: peptidase M15, partial [Methylobacteriaceae bacterium]|jgi:D-alanyl-D-alanine carboxypeptidase|nr:peptidase M15 [Methylobacteriaceae bacterium]